MNSDNVEVEGAGTPIANKDAKKGEGEVKKKRFQNGWTIEQERLMAEWSDIASCYRWLHDKSEQHFHIKTLWINLPVIILSTVGGTANFGIQSLFEDNELAKKYASFAIGGVSLFAGLLTTIGNYLRYAQYEESHRVASIAWGKFQRLIAVELALNPDNRMDSLDFLKVCRAELDRLIEQSPPLSYKSIKMFEVRFGKIKDLKKPDVCGALEHTVIYNSSEARLKQMAAEAALMLRRKKQTLNELLSPQIEKQITEQVEARINEAIEDHNSKLEQEIENRKIKEQETHEEYLRILEDRRKKIEEEIEAEKKVQKMHLNSTPVVYSSTNNTGGGGETQFEKRLNFRKSVISQHIQHAIQGNNKAQHHDDKSFHIDIPDNIIVDKDADL